MSTISSSTSRSATTDRAPVTATQKVGLVIAGFLALTNVPSVFVPTPDGETGPPLGILLVCTVLSVPALIGVVPAWRGSRPWLRFVAGANSIVTLTSLPALFVDVPMWLKVLVGVSVVITIVSVALMFSGGRRPASRAG